MADNFHIAAHIRSARAVNAFNEIVGEFLSICVWVPHELTHQIPVQVGQRRHARMGHLRKSADEVIVAVELESRPENIEVGERIQVTREVGVIIPIDEVVGHIEPRLYTRGEALVTINREAVVAPERGETYAAVVS